MQVIKKFVANLKQYFKQEGNENYKELKTCLNFVELQSLRRKWQQKMIDFFKIRKWINLIS